MPEVTCDEGKIMHVLVNLVDNAIKYTKEGGVTISAAADRERLTVTVRDTGIGLSEDEKEQVSDVFKRGMEAVRLDTGGSGLGLYIVKNILDAHGSTVVVSSEGRGKGAAVSFSLPLR
jgi:signal transduction histidine kinase